VSFDAGRILIKNGFQGRIFIALLYDAVCKAVYSSGEGVGVYRFAEAYAQPEAKLTLFCGV